MNTLGNGYRAGWVPTRGYESSFSPLQLLRPGEVEDIVGAVHRGELPADFQAKLGRLRLGDLQQTAIEQNCQLFFQLLVACSNGEFHRLTTAQVEAIAKVLAYVRKDDDVIPDYLPRGYTDDYQEVRAAAAELTPLLQSFKAWRLRNQVPSLWLERNSAQKPA